MKRFLFLLPWLCTSAWPHRQPVEPNHITLVGDPGQLVLRLEASAPWWLEDVFSGQVPPPLNWPEDLRTKAKAYVDKHVILKVDGQVLSSQLSRAQYSEEVWRYKSGSRLHFDLTYTLPREGQQLNGELTLYKEDYPMPEMEFVSYVHIDGFKSHRLVVPIEHPTFSVALTDVMRTPLQRWTAFVREGFLFWQQWPAFVLLFSAVQLLCTPLLRAKPLHLFLVGLAAGISVLLTLLTRSSPGFGLGVFLFLVLEAVALALALRMYRARLVRDSESLAPALFLSQTRFVSLVCAGIGVYLLIKGSSAWRM